MDLRRGGSFLFVLFSVSSKPQTTSGIGPHVFFLGGIGNQYADVRKQQQTKNSQWGRYQTKLVHGKHGVEHETEVLNVHCDMAPDIIVM